MALKKSPADAFTSWDKVIKNMKIRKWPKQPDPLLVAAEARLKVCEKNLAAVQKRLDKLMIQSKKVEKKYAEYKRRFKK